MNRTSSTHPSVRTLFRWLSCGLVLAALFAARPPAATAVSCGFGSEPTWESDEPTSFDLSGDTVAFISESTGNLMVYRRTAISWDLELDLSPSDTPLTEFHEGLSLDGDTLAVAEYGGPCLVFVRNGWTWALQDEIAPSWEQATSFLRLQGRTLLRGNHVYTRRGGDWTGHGFGGELTSILGDSRSHGDVIVHAIQNTDDYDILRRGLDGYWDHSQLLQAERGAFGLTAGHLLIAADGEVLAYRDVDGTFVENGVLPVPIPGGVVQSLDVSCSVAVVAVNMPQADPLLWCDEDEANRGVFLLELDGDTWSWGPELDDDRPDLRRGTVAWVAGQDDGTVRVVTLEDDWFSCCEQDCNLTCADECQGANDYVDCWTSCRDDCEDGCAATPDDPLWTVHACSGAESCPPCTPPEDTCAGAPLLALGQGGITVDRTMECATQSFPGFSCVQPTQLTCQGPLPSGAVSDVWYRVLGTGSNLSASTCGGLFGGEAHFDSVISVFKGGCAPTECVALEDIELAEGEVCVGPGGGGELGTSVMWASEEGVEYLIRLQRLPHPDQTGLEFKLNVREFGETPAHDDCINAEPVGVGSVTPLLSGLLLFATNPEPPACLGEVRDGRDVWFEVEGTGQRLVASTCAEYGGFVFPSYYGEAAPPLEIVVYQGSCTGPCIETSTNSCSVPAAASASWSSIEGETYLIQVRTTGCVATAARFNLAVRELLEPVFRSEACINPSDACGCLGVDTGCCNGAEPIGDLPDPNRSLVIGDARVVPHAGMLVREETDLHLAGKDAATDLALRRRHVTRHVLPSTSAFGRSWDHNFNQVFVKMPEGEIRMSGFGRTDTFRSVTPIPPEVFAWEGILGRTERLSMYESGPAVLRLCGGTEMHFTIGAIGIPPALQTAGTLSAIVSPNGNEITIERTDGPLLEQRILRIWDSFGRPTTFDYDHEEPYIVTSVTDFSGRVVSYTYDDALRLTSVTHPAVTGTGFNDFPDGKTVLYSYNDDEFEEPFDPLSTALRSITYPGSATPRMQWVYEEDATTGLYGYVREFTVGDDDAGGTYHYSYEALVPVPLDHPTDVWRLCDGFDPNASCVRATIVDPETTPTVLEVNSRGQVLKETIDGTWTRDFEYSPSGDLMVVTDPLMNRREKVHSNSASHPRTSHGVVTKVTSIPDTDRGGSPIVHEVVREPAFNQPFLERDPRGFETRYHYDYMEDLGSSTPILASRLGMTVGDLEDLFGELGIVNVGDVNEDGDLSGLSGNLVQVMHPVVTLPDDTTQAADEIFRHDEFGRVIYHRDEEGNVTTSAYGPSGYLEEVVRDADGVAATTRYEYGEQGTFPANERGVPTATIDPRGVKTIYHVNQLDQVVATIHAETGGEAGQALAYEARTLFDANNNVVEEWVEDTDNRNSPDGGFIKTKYEYNLLDWLEAEVLDADGLAIRTEHQYDKVGNRTLTIRGAGSGAASTELMVYDTRDLLARQERLHEGGEAELLHGRDANGNVTTLTDDDGDVTTIVYDGHDRKVQETDRVGNYSLFELDAASNVTGSESWGPAWTGGAIERLSRSETSFDARGRAWQQRVFHWQYDGRDVGGPSYPGEVLSTTRYLDGLGRVEKLVDAEGDESTFVHDGLSRVVSSEDPEGNVVVNEHDDNGNLLRQTDHELGPGGVETFVTEHVHDALNRLTLTREPNGQETTFEHDSRGNVRRTTDALGNQVDVVVDALSRVTATKQYLKTGGVEATADDHDDVIVTEQEWDELSRLTVQRDDKGQETTTTFDDLDRVTHVSFADGTFETRSYTDDGELINRRRPNGAIEIWSHDAEGRPTRVNINNTAVPNAVGTTQKDWEHDGLNRVIVSMDDNGGVDIVRCVRWFDSLGRQVREKQRLPNAPELVVDSEWEGAALRVADVYPDGREVRRVHDGLDRLTEIREGGNNALIASYSYVGPGRDALIGYGNGTTLSKLNVEGTSTSSGTDPGYDSNRRHLRHEWRQGSTPITHYRNEYDGPGGIGTNRRIAEVREHLGHRDDYEFDSKYRMTMFTQDLGVQGVTVSRRQLDGVDKMTQFYDEGVNEMPVVDGDPSEDGLNQYSSFAGAARTYDDNGSLASEGLVEYRHDYSGRLVQVWDVGTSELVAHYLYDDLNRRVRKATNGGADVTRYVYLDWQVLEERDGAGLPQVQHVDGRSIDEHVQMRLVPTGQDFYYHCNSQGFVGALTDVLGQPVEYYEYSWLGRPMLYSSAGAPIADSLVGNEYMFQGRRLDDETGLYYFRNRYYSPLTGEFLTIDPEGLWNHGQGNGYSAFAEDPWNAADPLGEQVEWHHLLPKNEFSEKVLASAGLDKDFIHRAEFGQIMKDWTHTYLHHRGWSKDWEIWLKENEGRLTEKKIRAQLRNMMARPRYKQIFDLSVDAPYNYLERGKHRAWRKKWEADFDQNKGQSEAAHMLRESWQERKRLWGRSGVLKRKLKLRKLPVIGMAFAVTSYSSRAEAQGFEAANSELAWDSTFGNISGPFEFVLGLAGHDIHSSRAPHLVPMEASDGSVAIFDEQSGEFLGVHGMLRILREDSRSWQRQYLNQRSTGMIAMP